MILIQYTDITLPPSWFGDASKRGWACIICKMATATNVSLSAWSKSLKNIPLVDNSFIEKWLQKLDKVPKKVRTRGYSNFCEGYVFDVEGKIINSFLRYFGYLLALLYIKR